MSPEGAASDSTRLVDEVVAGLPDQRLVELLDEKPLVVEDRPSRRSSSRELGVHSRSEADEICGLHTGPMADGADPSSPTTG